MSKEHAYAYEAGYHDGATHYELDHCPSCKNIADLQDALAENAKLRELIGDLREYIAGNTDVCDFCDQQGTCENHPAPPPCKYELTTEDNAVLDCIADSLSELGIEVD